MNARAFVVVMAVTMTVPLSAQQAVELANHAAVRSQVRMYELVVQDAVKRGGVQLAQKAIEVQPRVGLAMNGLPLVTGVYLPDQGYHFDVQVPNILPTSLSLFVYMQKRPGSVPVSRGVNVPGVAATGVVPDDPMKSAPPAAAAGEEFDPPREYGHFVRNSLVDAMIENSGALQLKSGERLTIRARVPQVSLDPLSLYDERELLLSVRADDLIAFRAGQIDKAEIQKRIREYRY